MIKPFKQHLEENEADKLLQPSDILPKSFKVPKGLILFENIHLDSYSGQYNFMLIGRYKGEPVGYMEYVEFEDDITVSYVFVRPDLRRQGIGKLFYNTLNSGRASGSAINDGNGYRLSQFKGSMMTDEGSKMKKAWLKSIKDLKKRGYDIYGKPY